MTFKDLFDIDVWKDYYKEETSIFYILYILLMMMLIVYLNEITYENRLVERFTVTIGFISIIFISLKSLKSLKNKEKEYV